MSTNTITARRATLGALALAAGILALLVTQAWGAGAPAAKTVSPKAAAPKLAKRHGTVHAHASAVGLFSVLGHAAQARDADDGALSNAALHDPNLIVAQARQLASDGQTRTWLVPAKNGQICLAVEPGTKYHALEDQLGVGHSTLSWICNTAASIASRGMALRMYSDITGLVPDGVSSVQTDVDGASATVPVASNLYHAYSDSGLVGSGSVSFHSSATGEQAAGQLP